MNHIKKLTIGGIFMIPPLAGTLYIPSFPALAAHLHTSNADVMRTLSIYFIGYGIGQLLWGTASDYIGRRKAMLVSMVMFLLCALWVSTTKTIVSFSIAISVMGFASAASTSIGNALLKDIYGKERIAHAISYVGIAMAVAPTIAIALGAYFVVWFGWQSIFYLLAAYTAILTIGIMSTIPETHHDAALHTSNESLYSAFKTTLTTKEFLSFIITLGIMFGAFFAYLSAAPFIFVKQLGYSTVAYGWIVFFTTAIYLIGTICNSIIIRYTALRHVVFSGVVIALIGISLMLIITLFNIQTLAFVLIPLSIFMFGIGLVLPAAKAGAMSVFDKRSGLAASMMKFVQTAGCVLVTLAAAELHSSKSILPITLLLTAIVALALLAFISLHNKKPRHT